MASFEGLPVELKEAIVLATPLRDLSNLSKTCKTIRAVALPAMFRAIDFTWDANLPDGPPLTPLLRSILGNMHFGRNIKRLGLRALNYRGFQAPGFNGDILLPGHTHRIPAAEWETFEKALEVCPCEEKGQCDDPTTREGNLNAGIAVLISHCMRIERLRIDVELLMDNHRLPAMLRSTIYRTLGPRGEKSWFGNLLDVKITRSFNPADDRPDIIDYRYALNLPVPVATFLKLFYLSAVKTLDIVYFPHIEVPEGIHPTTRRHTVWPFPQAPTAFSLTKLHLRRTSALPSTLHLLLSTTPNLSSLHYDLSMPASKTPVCLDTLRHALDRVRRTLQHVHLRWAIFSDDLDEYMYDENEYDLATVCSGSLGSLRDYDALLTLETSLAVLYGQKPEARVVPLAERLPPNLRRFTLVEDLWEVDAFKWDDAYFQHVVRFLVGESRAKEWFDTRTKNHMLSWTPDMQPEWRSATPKLESIILDCNMFSRFSPTVRYLSKALQREMVHGLCEKGGIGCEFREETFWYEAPEPLSSSTSSVG